MNTKQIHAEIKILAEERMTEEGIHHDDWVERVDEYIEEIIRELKEL